MKREFEARINEVIFRKMKGSGQGKGFDFSLKTTAPPAITMKATTVQPFKKPNVKLSGGNFTYVVAGLEYFQGYEFMVCIIESLFLYL